MNFTLKIWRQKDAKAKGAFETYKVENISADTSFLEMLDILNNNLIHEGKEPVAFDHDCREGICGMCSLHIDGRAHGPGHGGNAEHLAAGVPGGLHIAVLSLGLHVDGALPEGALEAAAVFHPAADVGQQLVLKGLAILSLQDHLAQFQQKDLLRGRGSIHHNGPPYQNSLEYRPLL